MRINDRDELVRIFRDTMERCEKDSTLSAEWKRYADCR